MFTLVTGASSGFGEACAHLFARNKKALILLARRKNRLEKLASELTKQHGVEVHVFELDVRDRAAVESFAKKNENLLSRVSVLINNAGLAKGMDFVQDGNIDDWEQMIDTNVKGLLYVMRMVAPHMVKARKGHIVNIGSVAGHWVYPKGNVYCATKHAVRALTDGMRMDLNGTGVRVTEVSPGMAQTEFSVVRLGDESKAKAVYQGMTPLTADDVAETVFWCCTRPAHVNIQEVVLFPTDQASPTIVARR